MASLAAFSRATGMGQHPQNGFDDFFHFFVGKPLLLPKHLLANQSVFDVGVVDRSPELDDWKLEGELLREIQIDDELEPFVGTALRSIDSEFPMEEIFLDGWHNSSASDKDLLFFHFALNVIKLLLQSFHPYFHDIITLIPINPPLLN